MTYRRFEARLERLEREFSEADSLLGEGLAALLAYARRHPQAEAEDRDDEDRERALELGHVLDRLARVELEHALARIRRDL